MKTLILLIVPVLLSGCVILPLPHTSPAGVDFRGQVVDAHTRRPLEGAKVSIEGLRRSAVVTAADGQYAVSSGSNFHLIYYANPSWSLGLPVGESRNVLLVEKDGYRSFRMDAYHDWKTRNALEIRRETNELPDRRLSRTTLILKPISLERAAAR